MSAPGALEAVGASTATPLGAAGGPVTLQALNEALAAAWSTPTPDAPVALANVGDTQASSAGALAPLAAAPGTLLQSTGSLDALPASAHPTLAGHGHLSAAFGAAATAATATSAAPGTQATAALTWAPWVSTGTDNHTRHAGAEAPSLPVQGSTAPWAPLGVASIALPNVPSPAPPSAPGRPQRWPAGPAADDATPSRSDLDPDQPQAPSPWATDGDATPAWTGAQEGADEAAVQAWLHRLQQAQQTHALDDLARGRAVLLLGAGQAWCLQRRGVTALRCSASGPAPRAWQAWRLFRHEGGGRCTWRARQPEGGGQLHLGLSKPPHTPGRHWAVAEGQRLLQALGRQWSLLVLALPEAPGAAVATTATPAAPLGEATNHPHAQH